MSNGVEDQIMDSFVSEDNKFANLFDPDRMKELFGSFVGLWQDPDKREEYETLKVDLAEKYMTDPAKFLGFIEESPDMHKDVISAADETGVDAEFLYNVVMQEGLSSNMSLKVKQKQKIYDSEGVTNTYGAGMDTFWEEQDLALQREYLKEKIKPDLSKGGIFKGRNEAGLEITSGNIQTKDVWRGTGALIQLNKDYLTSSFKKEGVDFNSLSKELQQFWLYSSYNAGAGNANGLFKEYGVDPFSNPKFVKKLKKQREGKWSFSRRTMSEWMENVGRVVGGTQLTDMYSPFSGELYK